MANYNATVTSPDVVQITDNEAVRDLLDEYVIWPDWDLSDGQLQFLGHGSFSCHIDAEDGIVGEPDTREFLYRLSQYVPEGSRLTIQEIGHTKLRHTVAYQYIVYPYAVFFQRIGESPSKMEPPASLAEVLSEATLERIDDAADPEARTPMSPFSSAVAGGDGSEETLQDEYPWFVADALENDDRVRRLDEDENMWEFQSDEVNWCGNAGSIRAFKSGFDAALDALE